MTAGLPEILEVFWEVIMRNVNQKQSDYINLEELDQEWVELISEAISMGLTKDEIRNFLLNNGRIMNLGQLARTV